jgi:hypothetical protein
MFNCRAACLCQFSGTENKNHVKFLHLNSVTVRLPGLHPPPNATSLTSQLTCTLSLAVQLEAPHEIPCALQPQTSIRDVGEHTLSSMHLRRHFSQLRCQRNRWQALETQHLFILVT